jgi:hypothetical protein
MQSDLPKALFTRATVHALCSQGVRSVLMYERRQVKSFSPHLKQQRKPSTGAKTLKGPANTQRNMASL